MKLSNSKKIIIFSVAILGLSLFILPSISATFNPDNKALLGRIVLYPLIKNRGSNGTGVIVDDRAARSRASYESILNYPSLAETKAILQNISISNNGRQNISAYEFTLQKLAPDNLLGYNGNDLNLNKTAFFENAFAGYNFPIFYREYTTRIIHSLWVEKNHIVPWSLKDYSPEQITILYWSSGIIGLRNPLLSDFQQGIYTPFSYQQGRSKLIKEGLFKSFLLAKNLKRDTTENTIKSIITWYEHNFLHAYANWDWSVYNGEYCEEAHCQPASLESHFRQRITGCQDTVRSLRDILASINIPAVAIRFSPGEHGVLYLPTINKFIHGDHVTDSALIRPDFFLLDGNSISRIEIEKSISYSGFLNEIMRQNAMDFLMLATKYRENNSLILRMSQERLCRNITPERQDLLREIIELSGDFHLRMNNQNGCTISTDQVRIKTLDELSF